MPPPSPGFPSGSKTTNPIASKVTAVLSTSYSDTEFRNALGLLDERGIVNDARTRRQIRLNLQKEVIDSNGEIISEFGRVSEVRCLPQIIGCPESVPLILSSNSNALALHSPS
jgi:hypothetical protein